MQTIGKIGLCGITDLSILYSLLMQCREVGILLGSMGVHHYDVQGSGYIGGIYGGGKWAYWRALWMCITMICREVGISEGIRYGSFIDQLIFNNIVLKHAFSQN